MQANDRDERALRFLGLAARAGRVIVGVSLICSALQKKLAEKAPLLVLLASDAAGNTRKRITDRTAFYGVPLIPLVADCERLALMSGKRGGAVAAVAVTEPGLTQAIADLYGISISS